MFWLLNDVRHALRGLTGAPGFTTAAMMTMALGIGVNTGIFSILNGLVLRDLPAPNAGELVDLHQEIDGIRRGNSGYGNAFATYEYDIYSERTQTLSGLIGYSAPGPAVLGGEARSRGARQHRHLQLLQRAAATAGPGARLQPGRLRSQKRDGRGRARPRSVGQRVRSR